MTPSLMPAGPDVWHMLDPSSVSVVIVIVLQLCKSWTRSCGELVGDAHGNEATVASIAGGWWLVVAVVRMLHLIVIVIAALLIRRLEFTIVGFSCFG